MRGSNYREVNLASSHDVIQEGVDSVELRGTAATQGSQTSGRLWKKEGLVWEIGLSAVLVERTLMKRNHLSASVDCGGQRHAGIQAGKKRLKLSAK